VQDNAAPAALVAAQQTVRKSAAKALCSDATAAAVATVDAMSVGEKRPNKLTVDEYCKLFESLRAQGIALR
jgi:16S rRNA A1518/A1519 N6-dimethyltransferase RsmA/KsgA/DIM1 with predicted DNA glycosylase/AP lyase activity